MWLFYHSYLIFFHQNAHHRVDDIVTWWMTLLHGGWHCYMVDDIVTWWMTLLHGGWHCYMVVDIVTWWMTLLHGGWHCYMVDDIVTWWMTLLHGGWWWSLCSDQSHSKKLCIQINSKHRIVSGLTGRGCTVGF